MSLIAAPVTVVPSHSLGALVGLPSLSFALFGGDTRSISALPTDAVVGPSGAGAVVFIGLSAATVAMAAACVRTNRPLSVLVPADDVSATNAVLLGWLDTLGVPSRHVAGSASEVRQAVDAARLGAAWQVVEAGDLASAVDLSPAFEGAPAVSTPAHDAEPPVSVLAAAVDACRKAGSLLVVSGRSPGLAANIASLLHADRSETLALPCEDIATSDCRPVLAVAGVPSACLTDHDGASRSDDLSCDVAERAGCSGVLTVSVTRREARAMQRLLAREEGLVTSVHGAMAGAALFRALMADRALRPRERRLRAVSSVLVLVPGPFPVSAAGPPLAEGTMRHANLTLAELARWLSHGCGELL